MNPALPPLPPALAARYQPLQLLGRGAFGVVLRVRHREDGREWALKLQPVEALGPRVAREIEASLAMDHPHLLRVHDGGLVGDQAYLVMELAEGNLQQLLDSGAPDETCWDLLRQAAQGVAALHASGLIHRDLKPENILVVGGRARVADLGLVRDEHKATMTQTGMIMGSPAYMAPEQARGERVSAACDLFGLGVIAYRILEGAPPYPELPLTSLLARVAAGRLDPLQRGRARLGPAGLAAVEAALAADPARRPPDAAAWAASLGPLGPQGAALGGMPAAPTRPLAPAPPASTSTLIRGRRWAPLAAGVVALGLALGLARGPATTAPPSPGPPPVAAAPAPDPGRLEALEQRDRTRLELLSRLRTPLEAGPRAWLREEPREVPPGLRPSLLSPEYASEWSTYLYRTRTWMRLALEVHGPGWLTTLETRERLVRDLADPYALALEALAAAAHPLRPGLTPGEKQRLREARATLVSDLLGFAREALDELGGRPRPLPLAFLRTSLFLAILEAGADNTFTRITQVEIPELTEDLERLAADAAARPGAPGNERLRILIYRLTDRVVDPLSPRPEACARMQAALDRASTRLDELPRDRLRRDLLALALTKELEAGRLCGCPEATRARGRRLLELLRSDHGPGAVDPCEGLGFLHRIAQKLARDAAYSDRELPELVQTWLQELSQRHPEVAGCRSLARTWGETPAGS